MVAKARGGKGKSKAREKDHGGHDHEREQPEVTVHPWEELSAATSFDIPSLTVLEEHHRTLSRFFVDTSGHEPDAIPPSDDVEQIRPSTAPAQSSTSALSFDQYCRCVHTLSHYGTSLQQFEFLFQTYAIESDRGISRSELFQMLQDHYQPPVARRMVEQVSDAKQFERLYTWIKKHVSLYDRTRCGFLALRETIDMLNTHPTVFSNFHFQFEPFIRKLQENNDHYREKALAAQIE